MYKDKGHNLITFIPIALVRKCTKSHMFIYDSLLNDLVSFVIYVDIIYNGIGGLQIVKDKVK